MDSSSPMPDSKHTLIRNSTAEFLIFTGQAGEQSIEARYEDETIWLTQKLMAELFAVDVRTVSEHLGNIFASGELTERPTPPSTTASTPSSRSATGSTRCARPSSASGRPGCCMNSRSRATCSTASGWNWWSI